MPPDATAIDASPISTGTLDTGFMRYPPLSRDGDSFRLLRVLPSLMSNSPLQCEVYAACISREEGQYVAGSYVWGPPEPTKSILLDGTPFSVRENLSHFLRAFRSRYRSQVIWLDAICINQDDVQERSHQVQGMKRIYSGAKCVYCWLGPNLPLPHTNAFDLHHMKDIVHWRSRGARQHIRRREQAEYIVQAEYWERLWIVQEFLLAKHIVVFAGSHRLSYRMFESIVLSWPFHSTPESLNETKTFSLIRLRRETARRSFESLFAEFGMLPCSVSLDGVFALLGLVGSREKDLELCNLIDYSLSVWQLLQCILDSEVLWEPFKFTECYNRHLIKGQTDKYMRNSINMELDRHLDWRPRGSDQHRYTNVNQASSHPAVQAFRTCVSSKDSSMDVYSSIIYTHNWTTVANQCCSLLRLSTESWELLHDAAFATYVLVETCDSQCTDVCASHAIIGFAGVLRSGGHEHQNTKPMVPTELRPSTDDASSGMLKLKRDAQQRIEELLRVGNEKARATQYKPDHYRLEMNLEFMVQLSIFMVHVEEGDWWALFQDPAELGEAL